jgi:hypothetical protein
VTRVRMVAMGISVGETRAVPNGMAERKRVTVRLSELAFDALRRDIAAGEAAARMESALRCYLGDSDSAGPAWPYPGFLRGSETPGDVQVEVEVPTELWRGFEEEAIRQGVTVEQLAEHAVFYFAAELDAGRVTQRILDDLESSDDDDAAG